MEKGPPIDWVVFEKAGRDGRFMELLVKLPHERWAERDKYGYTLLRYACRGPNVAAVVALVQSGLADLSSYEEEEGGWTLALLAASFTQSRVLEVLCASGANLRTRNYSGFSPLDIALGDVKFDAGESVRVLVANGVRLSTVCTIFRKEITPELWAFERGVLRCRTAVATLLHVKRAGNLVRWDKFLLREVAYAVWPTRYDKGWQN